MPKDNPVPQKDDWFGADGITHNEYPRIAIGDPSDAREGKDGTDILMSLTGVYEGTQVQKIEGKDRLLHTIKTRELYKGEERVLLWGNSNVDDVLPTLPPGTKVRMTFREKVKIGGGKTLKKIHVEWPSSVVRGPNRFLQQAAADDTPF